MLVYYFLALIFGVSALFLQSQGKRLALLLLFLVMAIIVVFIFPALTRLGKGRNMEIPINRGIIFIIEE